MIISYCCCGIMTVLTVKRYHDQVVNNWLQKDCWRL